MRQVRQLLSGLLGERRRARAADHDASVPKPASGQLIIFLSAVSDEFRGYRAQLRDDLMRAAEVGAVIQENFDAIGEGTLDGLDARIRTCAAVVHLIGEMCGAFPPPKAVKRLLVRYQDLSECLGLNRVQFLARDGAVSYTQWEAYLAIYHGRKLFVAEAGRDATREAGTYRRDGLQLASQQAHRERLRHLLDRWHELQFDGPDDIARKLLPALAEQHPEAFTGASIWSLGARQFNDYYLKGRTLDGKDVPAPFGGRQREMAHLGRWLRDMACDPRLLVSSPAGRGKSALLANWMQALRDTKHVGPDGWQLVFVPISNRFQTNRATTYLELLTRQLAQVAGEHVIPPAVDPEQFYRDKANRLIAGLAATGTRTLLVFDGLDEALGEERLAKLLPATMPPTLKVLASARWIAGDGDSRGWLNRLGWISTDRPADHDLVVERLSVDAVADVLIQMGAPIDAVGRDRPLVMRLTELTEGEPLLLRFYAEDLWLKTSDSCPITRAVLDSMQPGFGPYFKAWLQDQGGVAADAATQIDPRTTDATLAILGFAKGALTGKDLLGVATAGFPTLPWRLVAKPHVTPFRRFVIGDGSGEFPYVFSHPKVADYIRTDECAELADHAAAFIAWGRAHIIKLNSDDVRPEHASSYALDHYAEHLAMVGDTATADDYMEMVEDGWRRAKERHDGGPSGFASDVRAAWTACRRSGDLADLGAQWRCALTLSSIKSLGRNIPGPLLVELVKDGTLSPQQAQHYVMLKGATAEAVTALARIAVVVADNRRVAAELAMATIDLARSAHDECERIACLASAIDNLRIRTAEEQKSGPPSSQLDPALRQALLAEALAATKAIGDEESRSWALAALAPHLDPALCQAVLAEELAAAKAIGDEGSRSWALDALAPHLDPALRSEALAAAKAIGDEGSRSRALAAFAPHLDPALGLAVLAEALAAAKAIGDEGSRSGALTALAPHLDPTLRQAVLAEALAAAKAIGDEGSRSRARVGLDEGLLPNEYASLHAILRPVRHHSPLRDNLQPITLDLEEARLLCAIRGSKQHLLR